MEAIENMKDFSYYATYTVCILASFFPVISFFGHIFTDDGRKALMGHKWIIIYFILFFGFAYAFWFEIETLKQYIHLEDLWIKIIYIVFCFGPMLETDAVT